MKTTLLLLCAIPVIMLKNDDFLSEQKKYSRVRDAIAEKQKTLELKLRDHDLSLQNLNLLLLAYKDDDILEVYGKKKSDKTYKKICSYTVCSRSGQLGPKRKQGDMQVPEGFYHIDRFNPVSDFHLSLGLNYPNLSDKRKSTFRDLGGDIFIHGSCVTIGCLPMTDDFIKEIYLLAVYAKNNGQSKIPVYIFPFKMTDYNMVGYKEKYRDNETLFPFWANLKQGYDNFFNTNEELIIKVDEKGNYVF